MEIRLGLRTKSIIAITILLISAVSILSFFFINHEKQIIHRDLKNRGLSLAKNLAYNSEYGVLTTNITVLNNLVRGIMEQPDIAYCIIQDLEGKILTEKGLKEDLKKAVNKLASKAMEAVEPAIQFFSIPEGQDYYDISVPITSRMIESPEHEMSLFLKEGEWIEEAKKFKEPVELKEEMALFEEESPVIEKKIGMVHVVFSLTSASILVRKVQQTVIFITLVIVLIAGLITIFLTKITLGPIQKLVAATQRIARGDLSFKVAVKARDEIGTLANSFNRMLEDLSKSRDELVSSKAYTDNIIKSMADTLIVVDSGGEIQTINPATVEHLGYKEDELIGKPVGMLFVEERSKETKPEILIREGELRNYETCYRAKDGERIPILFSSSMTKDKDDSIISIVCTARDITERKRAEEQIQASLREKEILLKEVHHRVKNNLQVISSLINLQVRGIKKNKYALEMLRESQNRIRTIALIHEKLYQSRDLVRIDFAEYIRILTNDLFSSYGVKSDAITLKINVSNVFLDLDTAIPCGLIINELVSNSLRHAFSEDMKGEIRIDLYTDKDNKFNLIVRDNGVGFPKDLNFRSTKTLGLQLINTLTNQLGGAIELDTSSGTTFKITFKKPKYKERS